MDVADRYDLELVKTTRLNIPLAGDRDRDSSAVVMCEGPEPSRRCINVSTTKARSSR